MLGVDCSHVGHLVDLVHDCSNDLGRDIEYGEITSMGSVSRLLSRAALEHDLRG